MARVFITGSSDGLGQLAGQLLAEQGHRVVLHGRNKQRSKDAKAAVPKAESVVTGDLASLKEVRSIAEQVNDLGHFDAIIHNAGIGPREANRIITEDGFSQIFMVNTLAPYVLTALITRPKRLIYLSSGAHYGAQPDFNDILWEMRNWQGYQAYGESKFCDVLLAFAIARHWKDVFSNAVDPGWVPTKMGGPNAPDDLDQGYRTQAWLSVSDEQDALITGEYMYHQHKKAPDSGVHDVTKQEKLLEICARLSGVLLPR